MEEVLVSPRSRRRPKAHPSAERLYGQRAHSRGNPQDNYDASPRSARPPASNSTARGRDARHSLPDDDGGRRAAPPLQPHLQRHAAWQPPVRANGVLSPRPEENHDFELRGTTNVRRRAHGAFCGASSSASAVEAAVAATAGRSSGGAGAATAAEVGGGRIIELSTKTRHKSFAAVRLHSPNCGTPSPIPRSFPNGFKLRPPAIAAPPKLVPTCARHVAAPLEHQDAAAVSANAFSTFPPYTLAESRLQEGGEQQQASLVPAPADALRPPQRERHAEPEQQLAKHQPPAEAQILTPSKLLPAPNATHSERVSIGAALPHTLPHTLSHALPLADDTRRDLTRLRVARAAMAQLANGERVTIGRPVPPPAAPPSLMTPASQSLQPTYEPAAPRHAPRAGNGRAKGSLATCQRPSPRVLVPKARPAHLQRTVRVGTAVTAVQGPVLGIFATGPGSLIGDAAREAR